MVYALRLSQNSKTVIARSPPQADDEAISNPLISIELRLLRCARNDNGWRPGALLRQPPLVH